MFSNTMVALIFAVGAGAWIYAKLYRSSGGNAQSAGLIAGISGFLLFLLVLMILGWLF